MNRRLAQHSPPSHTALAVELRVSVGKLIRRLREESQPGDLPLSQMSVLGRLERDGPSTVTGLAREERMRPQSMGAITSSLESAGLINGVADPSDRRQTLFAPSPAGLAAIRASRSAREDWLSNAIASRLDGAEIESLRVAVGMLKRLVEP